MNLLSIPLNRPSANETALHTHQYARWMKLENNEKLMRSLLDELEGLFWGLAATDGTYHTWHVDANGFATFINVHAGYKLWIIATPLNPATLADPLFTSGFKPDKTLPVVDKVFPCSVEAIVLAAGDRL